MTSLLPALVLALAVSACSSDEPAAPAPPDGAQPLAAADTPLRVLTEADPGPEGEDPPCTAFAATATCTRVGAVVWALQADGGAWQLTAFDVDEELARWVPGLQGSGGGTAPTVTEVDLTDDEQPETLVVYGGGDVVGTSQAGIPEVVVHGEGRAAVVDGEVVAGDRAVRRVDGRWVSAPAP